MQTHTADVDTKGARILRHIVLSYFSPDLDLYQIFVAIFTFLEHNDDLVGGCHQISDERLCNIE